MLVASHRAQLPTHHSLHFSAGMLHVLSLRQSVAPSPNNKSHKPPQNPIHQLENSQRVKLRHQAARCVNGWDRW